MTAAGSVGPDGPQHHIGVHNDARPGALDPHCDGAIVLASRRISIPRVVCGAQESEGEASKLEAVAQRPSRIHAVVHLVMACIVVA